ncbi:uL14 family ribosomal protein, partial [Klebsiella quasipneumoniae]
MIQGQTMLNVADNSGATSVMTLKVMSKQTKKKTGKNTPKKNGKKQKE